MAERLPTVVVADDHALLLEEIVADLADHGFRVVGSASDARGAVFAALAAEPDLCLLDVNMPGDGIDAAARIVRELPKTFVVMLTSSRDRSAAEAARRVGVRGYLLKDLAAEPLAEALRTILGGELAFPNAPFGKAV